MREYEITVDLPEDRRLVVDLPDQFHPGKVVVKVLQQEKSFEEEATNSREHLRAFMESLPSRNIKSRTKEEIDAYIEEERNSWDR